MKFDIYKYEEVTLIELLISPSFKVKLESIIRLLLYSSVIPAIVAIITLFVRILINKRFYMFF